MAAPHGNQDSHPAPTPSVPSTVQAQGQTISFADSSRSGRPGPSHNQRPDSSGHSLQASTNTLTSGDGVAVHKGKKRRGGKKRRNRRQSFAANVSVEDTAEEDERPGLSSTTGRSRTDEDRVRDHNFYRLRSGHSSNESLGSEQALLDHR